MANIIVAYRYSPYTTANYLVAAFRRMGHTVQEVGPGHRVGMPPMRPDAFVWVEAGGGEPRWLLLPKCVPSAAWFLDSHSQGGWHREWAALFDHVFTAQPTAGFGRYLPVACDPETHTPDAGIEPTHDVVFVGHLYEGSPLYDRRRKVLADLGRRYDLRVYEGVYGHDMANAHATGRVVFNISAMGDLNMRVFEGMCSGRPLVTDTVEGLAPLFGDGKLLWGYGDQGGLFAAVDYLLEEPRVARKMGEAGRAAVLAAHTYDHRARAMLEEMGI
jgi:hypothetical protein